MNDFIEKNKETIKVGLIATAIHIVVSVIVGVLLGILYKLPIIGDLAFLINAAASLVIFIFSYIVALHICSKDTKIDWVKTAIVAIVIAVLIAVIGYIIPVLGTILGYVFPLISILVLEVWA